MATKTSELVAIKPIERTEAVIRIVGTSPLIVHKWSEKAKKQMLEAMQPSLKKEKKTKDRPDKRPVEEFVSSLYWLTDEPTADTDEELAEKFYQAIENGAKFGFPANSVKLAAMSGAYRKKWVPDKMSLRGAFNVYGTDSKELITICGVPSMREDAVTVGNGGTDLRYRGEFTEWYADIVISYDKNGIYTLSDIVNYVNAGGFCVGIGEWRAEKNGLNGAFEVQISEK